MKIFYFTFGQSHFHPETGFPMKNHWVEVMAESYEEAREFFMSKYGNKWAFQYTAKTFNQSFFPGGCYERLVA